MPTDDILWRKVDDLKSQSAEKPKSSPPAPPQPPENVTASPAPARQQARSHASKHDCRSSGKDQREDASKQSSTLAGHPPEWIETIRKVVKATGKEVAFTRLTSREKERLAEVVYGFRRQGIKASENEILRIAINYLLEDFAACGKRSFLQKVIAALLA